MDKKRALKNVLFSVILKFFMLAINILNKKYLILYVGNEANGLNSLLWSIVGILSIAELGIGTSISFCMYDAIVKDDNKRVGALYGLFKKVYSAIALVVLFLGICVTPFLHIMVKDYSADFNIYISFFIVLLSTLTTYIYGADTSLINSYKNNYITTIIGYVGTIIQEIIQIIILHVTKSFEIYLVIRILVVSIQCISTKCYTKKHYKDIVCAKEKIEKEELNKVTKNIKAMFFHKAGNMLINTTDSIIISTFISVSLLGTYSNYSSIVVALSGMLSLVFTSLSSVIGHFAVNAEKDDVEKKFFLFHKLNFMLGVIFFAGYYSVIDQIVVMFYGESLVLDCEIVAAITINYFIQFMRQSVLLFRDSTGMFYYDRYKSIIEAIINIILSILLLNLFGIIGVIVATILVNLCISFIIEPHVLYKYYFKKKPSKYYFINYLYVVIFVIILLVINVIIDFISVKMVAWQFLINGFISVFISSLVCVVVLITDKQYKNMIIKWRRKK